MDLNQTPATPNRPIWTAIVCGMANYLDGAVISAWSVVLVIYQQLGAITGQEFGIASGLLAFMVATGALTGGRIGDRLGRRRVFLITMALIAISAVGMMLATSFPLILLVTIGIGLGVGADMPVSMTTIAEHATDKNRGALLGLTGILVLIGLVVSSVLGGIFGNLGRYGATALLTHLLVVAILVFAARLTIPESHSWLLARAERKQGLHTVRADRSRISMLIRGTYAPAFLGLIVFYGFGGTAINSFGAFTSYLLVNSAGVDVSTAALAVLPALPVGMIAAIWFMRIVGGPHRFTYFIAGGIGLLISGLVPLIFGVSLVTIIISMSTLSLAGGFAGESMMRYWSQVSFPTLLRNTAQGAVIAAGRFGGGIFAIFTPALIDINSRLFFAAIVVFFFVSVATAIIVFRHRDSHNEFAVEEASDASVGITTLESEYAGS